MTTAVKEKKPFLPQRKPQVPVTGAAVTLRAGASPRGVANLTPLAIGGDPRVHLLPLEVTQRKKVKRLKRRLLFAGGLVVVLVAAAYGLATFTLATSQAALTSAQSATAALVTQQATYGAVTKVNADITSILQSQKTATAKEILWDNYLTSVEGTLPADAVITDVNASIDSPLGATAASTSATTAVPLQGPRIATTVLTVDMNEGEIPGWLNTLPSLKGFVDATPNSVTAPAGGGSTYVVVVTIHLNDKAVSGRFVKTAGATK